MIRWTPEFDKADAEARKRVPSHLDVATLIANAWNNASDISDKGIYETVEENVIGCFNSTVDMFIDQDCSEF